MRVAFVQLAGATWTTWVIAGVHSEGGRRSRGWAEMQHPVGLSKERTCSGGTGGHKHLRVCVSRVATRVGFLFGAPFVPQQQPGADFCGGRVTSGCTE